MARKKDKVTIRNPEKHKELRDALEKEPQFEVTKETQDCFLLRFKGREQAFPVIVVVTPRGYSAQVAKPKATWASSAASNLLRNIESDLTRARTTP